MITTIYRLVAPECPDRSCANRENLRRLILVRDESVGGNSEEIPGWEALFSISSLSFGIRMAVANTRIKKVGYRFVSVLICESISFALTVNERVGNRTAAC